MCSHGAMTDVLFQQLHIPLTLSSCSPAFGVIASPQEVGVAVIWGTLNLTVKPFAENHVVWGPAQPQFLDLHIFHNFPRDRGDYCNIPTRGGICGKVTFI
jgi:hypothetical protein